MTTTLRTPCIVAALLLTFAPANAARFVCEPVSDQDDGHLVDGFQWDWLPSQVSIDDLLINLGQEGSSTYDDALAFHLPDLSEGQTVSSAFLRLNQQGGTITSGLVVEITAALDLDPLATTDAARFTLPRTGNSVFWTISAPWDSSGQLIAKYEETPNLAPVINEVLAQPGWDSGPKDVVLFLQVFSAFEDNVVRYDDVHPQYWNGGNAGIEPSRLIINETFRDGLWGQELLCRPKPTSVEVNVIPHAWAEAFVEWGTDSLSFPYTTGTTAIPPGVAHNFTISPLTPDTQYWYRLNVRPAGSGPFQPGPTRTFVSLPVPGQTARMCVTSDIHVTNQLALGLDGPMQLLETTLAYMQTHVAPDRYQVWLDLGDVVVIRATRVAFDEEEVEQRYRTAREYIQQAAHSIPFVAARGNHEEVNGWDYDGTPDNNTVWSGKMALKYFCPPLPDEFYSGNTVSFPNIGLPGDYYAFDLGNMRLRVLDPFLYSLTRPHNGHGETGGSLDGWDWTLGQAQYDWLYDDLVNYPSTFSLLGIHHLTSCYAGPGFYYGRGGVEVAKFAVDGRPSFEWGGEDSTGAYVYATERPGFTHGATHDMLTGADNQVLIKGHDHFHARQALDGMVYVTMAKPDDTGEQTGNLWGWRYFCDYLTPGTLFLSNSGFYSIVVDDTVATYSYVQTYPTDGIGTVRDLFTVLTGSTDAPVVSSGQAPKTWIETVRPNPGPSPRIQWHLGRAGRVRLTIHDVSGRLVKELVAGEMPAGLHETDWDGRDGGGSHVSSGVYFAKLEADGRLDAVKMVILH